MQQAQVNLLADMGAQPATLMSGLVAATASTDHTAPTTTITTPASGASIANGASVTVTGTAADVGGVVAGVEVSTDGGSTWHPASGTTSWTYTYIQHGVGAADDPGASDGRQRQHLSDPDQPAGDDHGPVHGLRHRGAGRRRLRGRIARRGRG